VLESVIEEQIEISRSPGTKM